MKKIYLIKPDTIPYSLCADSWAKGFQEAGLYVEKAFSSEIDSKIIKKYMPDYLMCFNLNELKDGFLNDIYTHCPECMFLFNLIKKTEEPKDTNSLIHSFNGDKIIITSDKANLSLINNSIYIPTGIHTKKYKTNFSGYKRNITVIANQLNSDAINTIIDLIISFGKVDIYGDEIDYVNSLEEAIWKDCKESQIKELYKKSYKGQITDFRKRAEIFSSSLINIVTRTSTEEGIDYSILEATASCGFVLCFENKEILRMYDCGKEIETYKNSEELLDKVNFYIKNPAIIYAIAAKARAASVNNHSIKNRVIKVMELIKMKEKGHE